MTSKIENEKASAEQVGKVIKKAAEKKSTNTLIYVGPQIKGLQRFSSFINGYPTNFKEHLEKCPAFKQMFVKSDDFMDVEMKLKDSNSVESMFYEKTKEYFSEVK